MGNGASTTGKAERETVPGYYLETLNSVDNLASTLDRILKDSKEQEKFMGFLKGEFAEEVLEAYRDIVVFEQEDSAGNVDEAGKIVGVYFARNAAKEVNCKPKLKREAAKKVEAGEVTSSMFSAIKHDLVTMLARDKTARFVEKRRQDALKEVEKVSMDTKDEQTRRKCRRLSNLIGLNDSTHYMSPDFMRGSLGLREIAYPPVLDDFAPPLPRSKLGVVSCHGTKDGTGKSKVNQDRGLSAYPFRHSADPSGQHSALFLVADGHGKRGGHVADYVVKSAYHKLKSAALSSSSKPRPGSSSWASELVSAFETADADLADLDILKVDRHFSGCTLVAAVLVRNEVHVASAGDCKIVAGALEPDATVVAKTLTKSHTLNDPAEVERIEACGGVIEPCPGQIKERVWLDDSLTVPGLRKTRTLGDHAATPIGVIATPETASYVLTGKEQFLIIASDGVWEYVTEKAAVQFVHASLRLNAKAPDRAELAARYLSSVATKYWQNEGTYVDDITVTVVLLPPWEE